MQALDLEGTAFDDAMAALLRGNTSLQGMQLEYLSLGCVQDDAPAPFSADNVLKKLEALSELKRIWLDGLELHAKHLAEFKRRNISVRQ